MDSWLQDLHAARLMKLGVGDEDSSASKHGSIEADFQDWNDQLWTRIDKFRSACECDGSEQEKVCISSVCTLELCTARWYSTHCFSILQLFFFFTLIV